MEPLSPRVFLAGRDEYVRYAFVRPVSRRSGLPEKRRRLNAELGMGYRVSAATLLNASVRRDHCPVHTIPGAPPFPDGYAVAIQFSVFASATALLQN